MSDADGYSIERKTRLVDFSNPDCYDWENLVKVLQKIRNNESFTIPFYDVDEDVL